MELIDIHKYIQNRQTTEIYCIAQGIISLVISYDGKESEAVHWKITQYFRSSWVI